MAENGDSVVYDRFQRIERVQSSRPPFFVTAWKPLMPQKPARVAMSDNPLARWEKLAFDLLKSEMREKKIKSAFCPAKVVENNPVLAICKYHVFPRMEAGMTISRPEKFGGDVHYDNYEQLEADFVSGAMHPMDLKKACADCMIEILAPVREKMKV